MCALHNWTTCPYVLAEYGSAYGLQERVPGYGQVIILPAFGRTIHHHSSLMSVTVLSSSIL